MRRRGRSTEAVLGAWAGGKVRAWATGGGACVRRDKVRILPQVYTASFWPGRWGGHETDSVTSYVVYCSMLSSAGRLRNQERLISLESFSLNAFVWRTWATSRLSPVPTRVTTSSTTARARTQFAFFSALFNTPRKGVARSRRSVKAHDVRSFHPGQHSSLSRVRSVSSLRTVDATASGRVHPGHNSRRPGPCPCERQLHWWRVALHG